jgi:hypothetical protein
MNPLPEALALVPLLGTLGAERRFAYERFGCGPIFIGHFSYSCCAVAGPRWSRPNAVVLRVAAKASACGQQVQ